MGQRELKKKRTVYFTLHPKMFACCPNIFANPSEDSFFISHVLLCYLFSLQWIMSHPLCMAWVMCIGRIPEGNKAKN